MARAGRSAGAADGPGETAPGHPPRARPSRPGQQEPTAGTFVLVLPYATHRHPNFWDEPERFDPDRFLPEREAERHPYAYYPFGAGNRICLGNGFAVLEARILTALLARRFSARLVSGHHPQIEARGTLMVRNELPMQIHRRS